MGRGLGGPAPGRAAGDSQPEPQRISANLNWWVAGTQDRQPECSGVGEGSRRTGFAASTLAPLSSSSRTTSTWPSSAAVQRPVTPFCRRRPGRVGRGPGRGVGLEGALSAGPCGPAIPPCLTASSLLPPMHSMPHTQAPRHSPRGARPSAVDPSSGSTARADGPLVLRRRAGGPLRAPRARAPGRGPAEGGGPGRGLTPFPPPLAVRGGSR